MIDEYRPKVDLVKARIEGVVKGERDFEIELESAGIQISGLPGRDPIIKHDGHSYKIDEIPDELESKILDAFKDHNEAVRALKQIKYLNPTLNPLIKVNGD